MLLILLIIVMTVNVTMHKGAKATCEQFFPHFFMLDTREAKQLFFLKQFSLRNTHTHTHIHLKRIKDYFGIKKCYLHYILESNKVQVHFSHLPYFHRMH